MFFVDALHVTSLKVDRFKSFKASISMNDGNAVNAVDMHRYILSPLLRAWFFASVSGVG